MWRFVDAHAENFLSYGSLDFKFTHKGVTLIVGKNGSGKSTLFNLLAWVMYGEMPKALSKVDKVIRRGAEKCLGEVTVEDAAGPVTITRERGARTGALRVSGFDERALKTGQQEAIDARFGSYKQFITTSMFSGAVSSFCRMGDADRKGLMESMVGVGRYSVASEIAKKKTDLLTQEVEILDRNLPVFESAIQRLRDERHIYAMATLTHPVTVMREYRRRVTRAVELAERADAATTEVGEWIKRADAQRDAANAARAKQENTVADLEAEMETIDGEVNTLGGKDAVLGGRIREIEDDIKGVQTGKHADICPTCGQRWPHQHDPEKIAEAVQGRLAKVNALRKDRAPVAAELAEKRAARADVRARLDAERRALSRMSAQVDDTEYRRRLTAALTIEADLKSAQQAVREYAEDHDLDPNSEDLDRVEAELVLAEDRCATARREIADKREALTRYAFWRKGFSRTGLPSFLIDASIPSMNETAQTIAGDLTDGGLIVRFNPAAEKGSKSMFDVEVDYADGGEGFDAISRGEQTRVDIAVLFAIRDLAAKRSGKECGQLFLDELFDGADENFVESCLRMLRKHYGDRDVYLISHDPAAASLCDRVLTARKSKAVSKLS